MVRPRRRRRITAEDLSEYGSVVHRTVRVGDAAAGLGVSATAVRHAIRAAEIDLSTRYFRFLTGRTEADLAPTASPAGMLQAAYGRGPRGGLVDAVLAARDLGVSPGTIRRWAAGTQKPSPQHRKALHAAARRAAYTKRGRRAATAAFRRSRQAQKVMQGGRKIWIDGLQGPQLPDYARNRLIMFDFSPARFEDMLTAYEEGGDRGFIEWLTACVGEEYVEEWIFYTIEGLGFEEPS